ncbi:hypothetical protein K470DRAFT_263622 [Piedraia hortae CBS 480.64]|uniref:G protein-coupled receptor GPR1/2/3 C-terminal domain-containing protein n=1 Tax=Piedraia hortae CBS 480.64 TaxID=1314780 RepID=A0A6A7C374_9PEZI|nr:hypothetical protein K470DRAFT_263622 [Piedraia hortae CBS 480.64]
MATEQAMQQASASLSPLSPEHRRGLTAVAFFGLLSFISSTLLFLWLSYKVFTELRRRRQSSTLRVSQFLILIYNLIFADMLQSVGFMLNSRWVSLDGVLVSDKACIAQGWFISVGNLSSGVFTLAIAIHLFADITFDYHLPQVTFLSCLAALWCLVHVLAVAGFAAHASDYYARAGPWCWVSGKYAAERLWLHYFWVIVAEFGTVIIYGAILAILQRRLHTSYYATPSTALRARSAARLIIIYPIVYVVCTLPLIVVRLKGMEHWTPSVSLMCAVGALITCIGWLDVVVYGLTRGTLLFGRIRDNYNDNGASTAVDANETWKTPWSER